MHTRTLLLLLVMTASTAVSSGTTTDLSAIQNAAQRAVRAAIAHPNGTLIIHVQDLDPRLRLAACDQPLSAAITGDGQARAHSTVAVRCNGNVHWTLYLSATVESEFV